MSDKKQEYVYIAKSDGFYKIGISNDPPGRIKILSTASPHPVELIIEWESENAALTEKRLHKLFDEERMNGEWFQLDETEIKFLKTLAEHGNIDEVASFFANSGRTMFSFMLMMEDEIRIAGSYMRSRACNEGGGK